METLTVKELIDILKNFEDDALVAFSYPSHDYWQSVLVSEITEVDYATAKESSYHQGYKLVEEDEEDEEHIQVVLLS